MYADDTKMFREITGQKDREALQNDLDCLSEWAEERQLRLNVEKCKVMHLGGTRNKKAVYDTKQSANGTIISFQETTIEKVSGLVMT